jgi:hypothetical protein
MKDMIANKRNIEKGIEMDSLPCPVGCGLASADFAGPLFSA